MTTPRRASRNAGFTLVEALLATALMGVILAALATVTAQWLPNWNRGFTRIQQTEHLALGLERVVADIAAAEFVSVGREIPQPAFEGAELSVTFLRSAIGPNARPSLELVRIAEVGSERGPILVRTRAPFVPTVSGVNDKQPPVFGDPVVLVRAPFRVSFSYAGPDRAWRDTWRGAPQLPRAVRVTVRDAGQRTLAASTATIIHAEMPVDCLKAASFEQCIATRQNPNAPDPNNPQARDLREL